MDLVGSSKLKEIDESTKSKIAKAYQERSSLRGVGRIFNVSHQSILNWTKKSDGGTSITGNPYITS